MQAIYIFAFIISFLSTVQASSTTPNDDLGECLSDLVTLELSVAYNYLQLSSKFGTSAAYPGFSSLFVKLSDEDSSKGHDLVKFIALRKFKIARLINKGGIAIEDGLINKPDIRQGLRVARSQNKKVWEKVIGCHKQADTPIDANVQDYLESHLLDHHIEIDKHFADIEHRIDDARPVDKNLITFMIDEELLQTYGDRRKDIFS
jgi:ferritin